MGLDAYLRRIGFTGTPRADLDTLTRMHRAHLSTIPYENLDVMLKRPLTIDPEKAFDKLATRQRGGWCYEMNGALGLALREIGFAVTRMAGGVQRSTAGDTRVGNHLVLLVKVDGEDYVADVGFGDGLYEPAPLAEGEIAQGGFISGLELIDDGWWRYHNHQHGGAPDFDFRAEAADPALLASQCAFLQTDASSPFTQNVVLHIRSDDSVEIMRNSLRFSVRPDGVERYVIASADDFMREIETTFHVDCPEARTLWPLAEARGREMLEELQRPR